MTNQQKYQTKSDAWKGKAGSRPAAAALRLNASETRVFQEVNGVVSCLEANLGVLGASRRQQAPLRTIFATMKFVALSALALVVPAASSHLRGGSSLTETNGSGSYCCREPHSGNTWQQDWPCASNYGWGGPEPCSSPSSHSVPAATPAESSKGENFLK